MASDATNLSTVDDNSQPIINDIRYQRQIDFTQHLDEQSALLLNFQQQIFKATFENWKQFSEIQINSAIDFFQSVVEQGLSARERLGLITEQQLRRLQEIAIFEQSLTLDAVEIFHAQSGAMREQVADIWQPTSNPYNEQ